MGNLKNQNRIELMASKNTATNYDVDSWIEQLKKCEYIKESEVKALCTRAKEILLEESNV